MKCAGVFNATRWSCTVKKNLFLISRNHAIDPHPASSKRGVRVVTIRRSGLRWTWSRRCTSSAGVDGEVVWSWHPGAGVKLMVLSTSVVGDGGKRAGPRGDHV